MIAFLKLIRLPNLLIIAGTQYLIRYCVIRPLLLPSGMDLQLGDFDFFLLSLSTVMIAAAGYVINDYFDTKTDTINRPESVVIDRGVKRRVAIGAHVVINFIGILLGTYVGIKAGIYKLGLIHVLSAGVLWFYSTNFKRQLIIGNLMVSILTALVPMIVVLYEIPLLNSTYHDLLLEANANLNFIIKFVGAFALFAFLTSLVREIVKDMEDIEGDMAIGCSTIPIAFGMPTAKGIVLGLILLTSYLLSMIQSLQFEARDLLSFYYTLAGVQVPLLILALLVIRGNSPRRFHNASIFIKVIMLIGVLYSLVIHYSMSSL